MQKLSILLPVYNAEKYVDLSIKSLLAQTYTDFELLILDDASTDSSLMRINKYKDARIKIFKNKKNMGVASGLNSLLKHAQGTYISRMDADDIALPQRLKVQLKFLFKHPELGVVGSDALLINAYNRVIGKKVMPHSSDDIRRTIFKFNPFIHTTLIFRKEVLDDIGNYDERFNGAEDYDLLLRLVKTYKTGNLDIPLVKHRISPRSITSTQMRKTEIQSIRARWNAIVTYGYPKINMMHMLKPSLFLLIPTAIKRRYGQVKI